VAGPTSAVTLGVAVVAVTAFTAMLPATAVWVVLHADGFGARAVALGRRWHLLRPEPVLTYQRPLERTASDLRRLSAELRQAGRGMSAVRWRGLQMAYDDTLVTACRSLEVVTALRDLPDGMDREIERIRVEAALEQAGLRFRTPIP
jgi:hypothetical protein